MRSRSFGHPRNDIAGNGDWGLGKGPNPQSPIPIILFCFKYCYLHRGMIASGE